MIPYPQISPEIFRIGPLAIRWYGLMYVIGFTIGFQILKARIRAGYFKIKLEQADSYLSHLVVGMLIGARLVYVTVYNWDYYSTRLIEILYVQQGGLSFHGAALGMIASMVIFARRNKVSVYSALDTLALTACLGLAIGRVGNFINAELYGRVTDVPWAMIFPSDPKGLPRHPSQLYQGLTEGLLLFLCLSFFHRKMKSSGTYRDGKIGAMFLILYGAFRFVVEFTREPDEQLGYVLSIFSMGQILCILTSISGVLMWLHAWKISPDWQVPKKIKIQAPPKQDFLDRRLWWPLERFLARFVA